jgi:pimeloyl-ACP methyl ester carboxylesterase
MIEFERSGVGPSLVLVHGITESRRTWDPLIEALSTTHDVVAVDLRGHGMSNSLGEFDVISLAGDVHEVVDSLGINGPLLIGHSLGGTVVSAYAAIYPCRGVINVDQPMRLGDFQSALRLIEPQLRGDEDEFRVVMDMILEGLRGSLGDEEWQRLSKLRRVDQDVVLAIWSAVLETEAQDLEALVNALAGAITVPYLSLHGSDPGEGYEAWLKALVENVQYEEWEDRGHYPHLVEPERFVALVDEFESSLFDR